MRKAFLAQRPLCEAHPILFPADGTKATTVPDTIIYNESATDIHHMAGRYGGNYLNRDTWLPLCRNCHQWIGNHPKEAEKLGLLDPARNKATNRIL